MVLNVNKSILVFNSIIYALLYFVEIYARAKSSWRRYQGLDIIKDTSLGILSLAI
jgi:hypothetical protein